MNKWQEHEMEKLQLLCDKALPQENARRSFGIWQSSSKCNGQRSPTSLLTVFPAAGCNALP